MGNPSCSKLYFSPSLAVAVAVAAALPSPVILIASRPSVSTPRSTLVPSIFYVSLSPALSEPLPFVAGEVRLVLLKVILYCCSALYSSLPRVLSLLTVNLAAAMPKPKHKKTMSRRSFVKLPAFSSPRHRFIAGLESSCRPRHVMSAQ